MSEKTYKGPGKTRCPVCKSSDKVYETAKQYLDTHAELYCDRCGYHWTERRGGEGGASKV